MSEKPIQLITNKNDYLEITTEGLIYLLSLKNQKLYIISINGPDNSELFNKIIGFNLKEENNNLYIWGKPLDLNDNYKILLINYNSNNNEKINNNLFLLNILLSTHFIYSTKNDLNDEIINTFINNINIKNLINIKNKQFLPEIIFINDKLNENEIKNKIINNENYIKNNIFNSQKFITNIKNIKDIINNSNKISYLDGESFFGLIQNLINYINHNEKIDLDLAYENILLNKTRIEYNNIFEEYKNELHKKIEYPMTIQNIYKIYFELNNNYITSFSQKINSYNLNSLQIYEYINELNSSIEKEINNIINKNNSYYESYFITQYSIFEKNLNDYNDINNNLKEFIENYCTKFESCLFNFFNIMINSENNSNKIFVNILIKMYQELFINKLIKISSKINDINNSQKKELNEKILELNNNINKIKEEYNNINKILEQKNNEISLKNKNYFELETKFDKFNRDYKIKLKENENILNIEIEKYKKMENYYLSQIKEKEKIINTLENKIEKNNQNFNTTIKENNIKINELNRENNRLLNELERLREIKKGENNLIGNDKNINIPSLLKTVNKNFLDFKESVDNLNKENNNIQKNKYLELTKEEIDTKLNNVLNDIKNFCSLQIKNVSDNYEKIIKKVKTDFEELNFELSKKFCIK